MPLGEIQAKMTEEEGSITAKSYHKNTACKVPCCSVHMLLAIKGYHIFIACFVAAGNLHQYPDTNLIFLKVLCHGDETQSFLLVDVRREAKVQYSAKERKLNPFVNLKYLSTDFRGL